jgi:DNA-binding MarR family transcriptional regulator
MADEFPARIAQFIDQHIESLAQLEALLLLRKQPERAWDIAEIAKSLYITAEMASSLLADMERRGWAQTAPGAPLRYCYRSQGGEADQLIDELASIYHERRVAVISQIYSKPLNKVQTFADAFRLRREEPQ